MSNTSQNPAGRPVDEEQQQGVDKSPGEDTQQHEQVTNADLKGKKVDADLSKPEDQPLTREAGSNS